MLRKLAGFTLLALSTGMLAVSAQQGPATTVQGVVLDTEGNRPIAKVTVELRDNARQVLYVAVTRDDGRFSIPNVAARQYKLTATRNGYVLADPGDRARDGRDVIAAGAGPSEIRVGMTRTVSVSGRITDRTQQPLVNVHVQAMRLTYDAGKKLLTAVGGARTNDLGEFRIYWLPPGRYYVMALPIANTPFTDAPGFPVQTNPNVPDVKGNYSAMSLMYYGGSPSPATGDTFGRKAGENEALVPTYFPGTINEGEAAALDLRPGQDFRGADLILAPVRPLKIKGIVMDGVTRAPARKSRIVRVQTPASGIYFQDEVDQEDGRFEITALPGHYSLRGYTTELIGNLDIDMKDRDLENVVIVLNQPTTLPARVSIDGRSTPGGPEMGSLRVHLAVFPDAPGTTQINGKPDANGSTVLPYLEIGDYRVAVEPFEGIPPEGDPRIGSRRPAPLVGRDSSRDGPLPPIANSPGRPFGALSPMPAAMANAYVKAIRFDDKDLPDGIVNFDPQTFERQKREPKTLEIVLGLNGATVQGTLPNAPSTNVVLVPNNPLRSRLDLYKAALTDPSGSFRMTGVAPGDYKIFAWSFVENGAWMDPDFLRTYEDRGAALRVAAGATVTANPTVIP